MKIAFLLLACFATCATAQTMNERVFEYRGTKYATKVPNSPPAQPAWTPGQGEPPVTVAKALALADAEYQKVFKAFDTFELQTISLNKQGPGWMYMVVYLQKASDIKESAPGPGKTSFKTPLSLVYYITLDGTVHAPAPK